MKKKHKTNNILQEKSTDKFCIVYYLNGTDIEIANTIMDSGILLDKNFAFKDHMNYVINKAKSVNAVGADLIIIIIIINIVHKLIVNGCP